MNKIIISFILFFLFFPMLCFGESVIPHDSFIEITGDIMDKLDAMEEEAKHSNFNQLKNPTISKKFEDITILFKKYKRYTPLEIKDWSEGLQKKISLELLTVDFIYMLYSINQNTDSINEAEKSLQEARDLFREYIKNPNKK